MRHTRMRDMLSRRMMDGRRGRMSRDMGYDMARGRGRDYAGGMDYTHSPEYAREYGDRMYDRTYQKDGNDYQQYGNDSRDYATRRVGNFDYETYDGARGRGRGREYGYDMNMDYGYDMGMDYASGDFKLTTKELKKWEKSLENFDGTNGGKFMPDQVKQVAQQLGIKFDEFSPELLTTMTNVMYSDYGETIKGDISIYVKMAKAFLCDDDFDGEPEEKAYLYYKSIVEKED